VSTQLYTRLLSLATYAMCWFFCMYDRKGLPSHFCDTYILKQDAIITLLDEKDEEFDTNYLAYKKGLSGGWAGFALCHKGSVSLRPREVCSFCWNLKMLL